MSAPAFVDLVEEPTRRIERKLTLRCDCGKTLECPRGLDVWAWVKGAEAHAFLATHAKAYAQIENVKITKD